MYVCAQRAIIPPLPCRPHRSWRCWQGQRTTSIYVFEQFARRPGVTHVKGILSYMPLIIPSTALRTLGHRRSWMEASDDKYMLRVTPFLAGERRATNPSTHMRRRCMTCTSSRTHSRFFKIRFPLAYIHFIPFHTSGPTGEHDLKPMTSSWANLDILMMDPVKSSVCVEQYL